MSNELGAKVVSASCQNLWKVGVGTVRGREVLARLSHSPCGISLWEAECRQAGFDRSIVIIHSAWRQLFLTNVRAEWVCLRRGMALTNSQAEIFTWPLVSGRYRVLMWSRRFFCISWTLPPLCKSYEDLGLKKKKCRLQMVPILLMWGIYLE